MPCQHTNPAVAAMPDCSPTVAHSTLVPVHIDVHHSFCMSLTSLVLVPVGPAQAKILGPTPTTQVAADEQTVNAVKAAHAMCVAHPPKTQATHLPKHERSSLAQGSEGESSAFNAQSIHKLTLPICEVQGLDACPLAFSSGTAAVWAFNPLLNCAHKRHARLSKQLKQGVMEATPSDPYPLRQHGTHDVADQQN